MIFDLLTDLLYKIGQNEKLCHWLNVISLAIVFMASIYFMVSSLAYRFSHPEMTETQLLLHTFDALLWK